jgi:hypothetical protein
MIFYEKNYEAKRFGRFNNDFHAIEKTVAYLSHETDSVKPDKSCFRSHCRAVLNKLYLFVIINLNIQLTISNLK